MLDCECIFLISHDRVFYGFDKMCVMDARPSVVSISDGILLEIRDMLRSGHVLAYTWPVFTLRRCTHMVRYKETIYTLDSVAHDNFENTILYIRKNQLKLSHFVTFDVMKNLMHLFCGQNRSAPSLATKSRARRKCCFG